MPLHYEFCPSHRVLQVWVYHLVIHSVFFSLCVCVCFIFTFHFILAQFIHLFPTCFLTCCLEKEKKKNMSGGNLNNFNFTRLLYLNSMPYSRSLPCPDFYSLACLVTHHLFHKWFTNWLLSFCLFFLFFHFTCFLFHKFTIFYPLTISTAPPPTWTSKNDFFFFSFLSLSSTLFLLLFFFFLLQHTMTAIGSCHNARRLGSNWINFFSHPNTWAILPWEIRLHFEFTQYNAYICCFGRFSHGHSCILWFDVVEKNFTLKEAHIFHNIYIYIL